MFVGLDFGTTNSALALADADGNVELTQYEVRGRAYDTFRSVLYFDPQQRGTGGGPLVTCGMEGIFAYLGGDGSGRFVQSIKSHLASDSFKSTIICGRPYTLEQLVAHIVGQLAAKAQQPLPEQIVVGRPVRFVGDDPEGSRNSLAEQRLRTAVQACGFAEVHFELEPVAAAYQYESRLGEDELVLIADFGGGTTDLCLVDVGPKARRAAHAQGKRPIRATDGVALAGDCFDQRIIQNAIAPRLGLGTKYRVLDGDADVPRWVYASLAQWHLLSFLKTQKTMQMLEEVVASSYAPTMLAELYRIVDEDLGYRLHQAVERAKITLTSAREARIDFDDGALACTITRAELERWIADDLDRIASAIDRVLAHAQIGSTAVDRVFMTGGSSLVPAVRRLFAKRFGDDKLRGGEEMTSVGRGLALVARDLFAPK
jgi:hypothetical chaperone protein